MSADVRPGSAHSLHALALVGTGSCNLLGHLDDGLTLLGDETGCLYELLLGVQFSTLTSAVGVRILCLHNFEHNIYL